MYTKKFYQGQISGSVLSAKKVVPVLMKIFHPDSVLDVGCGLGGWLAEFEAAGCCVTGVDGGWVNSKSLLINEKSFMSVDLEACAAAGKIPGLKEGQRFSIVTTFEVAEHLRPEVARQFVKLLTTYSNVVIFSAAIPYQGGTNHVNERWPDYWVDLFSEVGYELMDIVRPAIWEDKEVEPWYRQNMLAFIRRESMTHGLASYTPGKIDKTLLRVVHPDFFLMSVELFESNTYLRSLGTRRLIAVLWEQAWSGLSRWLFQTRRTRSPL